MSLEMSRSMSMGQKMHQKISSSFGETIGDIPMYSLHRIKRLLFSHGELACLSVEMKNMLSACLLEANAIYKEESSNDWSCLTSNNLVWALERMNKKTSIAVNQMRKGQPREMKSLINEVVTEAHVLRKQNIDAIEKWFADNSEKLFYDMQGSVPWSVIKSLRESLSLWVTKKINPFGDDIEDAIMAIASANGICADDADSAWKKMGGKLFTQK